MRVGAMMTLPERQTRCCGHLGAAIGILDGTLCLDLGKFLRSSVRMSRPKGWLIGRLLVIAQKRCRLKKLLDGFFNRLGLDRQGRAGAAVKGVLVHALN
jgi:hypothetical protein